jgi:hypothetical protein
MADTIKYYHNIDLIKNKVTNLLLNPLTSTERNALTSSLTVSDEGYTTYDTTLNQQFFWDGTAWITSGGGGGGGAVNGVTATSPITSSGGSYPNISTSMASGKLIGRSSAGTGVFEEITLGTGLSFSGSTLNASAAVTPAALTKTDDTNVTLTLTGTPATSLLQSVNLTLGWTGTLADGRIASASTWNSKQAGSANLTSLSGLTYGSSVGFVKMSSANTFTLDTNTYITGNQTITLSGDVSGSGSTSITTAIGANKVTNSMLAQVATSIFKGRVSAGTGNVEDLTATQATSLLNTFTSSLKGLTPASGGGTTNFLRADGTWAAPPGGGGPSGPTGFEQHFLLMGA